MVEVPKILVFTKIGSKRDLARTLPGYYHQSIPAGQAMLRALSAKHGFECIFSDDSSRFTGAGLAPFDAIIFLNPNGFVFNADERRALQNYLRSGKGYVGIHAAANCELDWPWYGNLIGAYECGVNASKSVGRITILDTKHPSTTALPQVFSVEDEWLKYTTDVATLEDAEFRVLAVIDESAYREGTNTTHAISWCRKWEGARIWYTGFGHHPEVFNNPHVIEHIGGGIIYALGLCPNTK